MNSVPLAVAVGVFAFHANKADFDFAAVAPAPTHFTGMKFAVRAVAHRAIITFSKAGAAKARFFRWIAVAYMTIRDGHQCQIPRLLGDVSAKGTVDDTIVTDLAFLNGAQFSKWIVMPGVPR